MALSPRSLLLHHYHHKYYQRLIIKILSRVRVSLQESNHSILALYAHHGYNFRNFKDDIALIKIPKLKRFNQKQRPICLPRDLSMAKIIQVGNEMYAIGWGRTTPLKANLFRESLDFSKNPLKQVKLPFKANKFCENLVKNKKDKELEIKKDIWYFNSNTQLCAGDVTGQNDTCSGDSGGPAMVFHVHPISGKWRWFQVGIVSWGDGCAQKGEVGYYTKVSAFVDWIDQTAKPVSAITPKEPVAQKKKHRGPKGKQENLQSKRLLIGSTKQQNQSVQ